MATGVITIDAIKRMCRTTFGPVRTERYLMNRTKKELVEFINTNGLAIDSKLKKSEIVNKIMDIARW